MALRVLQELIRGMPASDGAGVRLTRSLGARPGLRLDPFLMLDEFCSDEAADYIGGFPAHPHRGFETVTYMLDGHMLHEDHMGNTGNLRSGDVQWMTAGRGIIHSEMPQQREGRMRGFQLWINLPAAEKMQPPAYRDIPAAEIPVIALPAGEMRLIAGNLDLGGRAYRGPVHGLSTDPLLLDLRLDAGAEYRQALGDERNLAVYVYEGQLSLGDRSVSAQQLGVLGPGDELGFTADAQRGARALLLAGRPLNEPVAQYGPFVMNTREEVMQAIEDFEQGRLTAEA